ncbi:MAG: ferredoxin family protein [Chloroflexi bacterium]|nr:ferredoxin family protein [Chloroflexota bacterium]
MPYVIAEPCIGVKDRSCVDVCPVDCIYEADDILYIHPEECIDCGACQPVCPVEAIFESPEALPEKWAQYAQMNADLAHSPPKGQNMLPKDWAAAGGKTT